MNINIILQNIPKDGIFCNKLYSKLELSKIIQNTPKKRELVLNSLRRCRLTKNLSNNKELSLIKTQYFFQIYDADLCLESDAKNLLILGFLHL
jgi:hypothetical protein